MKFSRDSHNEVVSILGEGMEIEGELTFTHGIRVDGAVKGKIRSEAFLQIGSKGRVQAEVEIRRITINGEFRGAIRASDRVEIHKEGKVFGDIFTPCLIIEAGAIFEGKCSMTDRSAGMRDEGNVFKVVDKNAEVAKGSQTAAASKSSS